MNDITITFVVLAVVVALFVIGRIPVGIIAIGTALALYATGVISMEQALAGFGDPTVVFIAALFVVSEALDATGVTTWAGEKLLAKVGDSRVRLVSAIMLLVAALTALISVNGAVAALIPMVVVLAVRLGRSTSQLLLPLAFAAHAGSMLTLTGTPVNIIVSDAAADAGAGAFGFFDFTLIGAPLVLGTITIAVFLGPRVLPHRAGVSMSPDLSRHAKTLAQQYSIAGGCDQSEAPLITKEDGVVEVIVPPRSEIIGDKVFPGMVTDSGDLVILAVQRAGENCGPNGVHLAPGDTLLLQGSWDDLDARTSVDPNVLVVDPPALIRKQAAPLGTRAVLSLAVVAAMVIMLTFGIVPSAIAGLLAACAMVLLRVISVEQAHRSISWTTLILVGGMIPLSTAIQQTGAAEKLANGFVDLVGDSGPYVVIAGLFLVTATLGQLISNTATALIITPIAVSVASELNISVLPVLMTVTVAAAASFLTPVATPANMMVMGPGGYKFGDYWKLGLPLLLWFLVVATVLIPVIWSF
ncbi:SLC13 family permease [Rhodococcus sp. OK302]|uniref:SLC13 family permease n=1 Tax=Rhodococcus sp. OK302 TaxID=1882769 RepID=UPI000B944BD1|nr:SLC13 family permease [Rhodococcus sp. OK302]OYD71687.1 di/tricarboxylate transporter [Rhodococcus sp. OK302]